MILHVIIDEIELKNDIVLERKDILEECFKYIPNNGFFPYYFLSKSGKDKVKLICPKYPSINSGKDNIYKLRIVTEEEKAYFESKQIITPELLINNGWELYKDPVKENLTDEDKKQLNSEGVKYDYKEYTYIAKNHDADEWKGYWFLTMSYDLSNTLGRDWYCRIDNNCHESVASVDIGTIRQFNKLMDLMDIEYRL